VSDEEIAYKNLDELRYKYGAGLKRFGEYVTTLEKSNTIKVVLQIKNQAFQINHDIPATAAGREIAEWTRIVLCGALNVMHILVTEGIDTSDIPEWSDEMAAKAVVGKFHRPKDIVQPTDKDRWPFP
jgi:hypothetical protein